MSRALVCSLTSFLALAACGDDGGGSTMGRPDARPIDAPLDTCDYTEQSDATNDATATDPGTPEPTGIVFGARAVLCGVFEHTHWDQDITVDVDSYTFELGAEADLLFRLFGAGAESLEYVGLDVYPAGTTTLLAGLTFYGNHGVISARLPAGSYEVLPFVLGSEAIQSSVPYRVEIVADNPDARCAEITTGGYMEGSDTGASANEVVALPSGNPAMLTTASDAPEPTNIVIAPGTDIRIAGEAKDIAAPDQYEDKDTYLIAAGAGTNELTVRLAWPTAGANLDWLLFEENNVQAITRSNATATTGLEMQLTAIKPNASYWLLVGARAGATVPTTYNVTLCGAQFTPP